MHGLTFMAYDTDRPTMPGLRSSRPNTANSEANKIMQLPTNSSRMASHLKHIKHYYTVKKQKRNIRLEEVIQFTKSCNIHLYNYMHARTNACMHAYNSGTLAHTHTHHISHTYTTHIIVTHTPHTTVTHTTIQSHKHYTIHSHKHNFTVTYNIQSHTHTTQSCIQPHTHTHTHTHTHMHTQ